VTRTLDAPPTTKSPCIGRCGLDAAGICGGCLRTRAEIKAWRHLHDAEKIAINRRVAALAAAGKDAKRLRKLERKIRKLEAKLDALRDRRRHIEGKAASHPSRAA
jgi:predicted Fe-S protein YdhL (DUF1289 family)